MLKFLKYSFLLATAFLLQSNLYASDKNKSGGEADCENYVSIQGSSNINQFQFIHYDPKISEFSDRFQNENLSQHILIPVYEFDGPNDRMLNDFYEMVNAQKYPNIHIGIEPKELADFDETTGMTNFRTKITIAGNSRNYVIPCQVTTCESSELVLRGNLEVELTDFNIDPPRKVFGAVKVNNEVFINFVFNLHSEEETLTEKITP
jgi:hypothetical protein